MSYSASNADKDATKNEFWARFKCEKMMKKPSVLVPNASSLPNIVLIYVEKDYFLCWKQIILFGAIELSFLLCYKVTMRSFPNEFSLSCFLMN